VEQRLRPRLHIVDINEGKLKTIPQWSPNPFNTKSEQFIKELLELAKTGKISTKTLLRYIGLDSNVEIRRIVQELATDQDDVQAENVPVSFVQQTVQPDSGGSKPVTTEPSNNGGPGSPGGPTKNRVRKTNAIPPTKQPGRPRT
jgi:hypothetical protein